MDFNKQTKRAVNFLVFCYFGITMECEKVKGIDGISGVEASSEADIVGAAIKRAYRDATQQGAFNALIPKGTGDVDEICVIKEKGKRILKKEIKKLLDKSCVIRFDDWHKNICEELIGTYGDINKKFADEVFSYGNAQKWVNMTLKYLDILYQIFSVFEPESDFVNKYGFLIDKYSRKFHVPVDSYMIEKSWPLLDVKLPLKDKAKREKNYKCPYEYVTPWSQWCDEEYTEYQKNLADVLEENMSPLEWENQAWIEAVKARKVQGKVDE